jgi:hypothetical protein
MERLFSTIYQKFSLSILYISKSSTKFIHFLYFINLINRYLEFHLKILTIINEDYCAS